MKGDRYHAERQEQRSSANETWHLVEDPVDGYDPRDDYDQWGHEYRRTS